MTAARSIAARFSGMPVDTLLCLEGTEYIGAYLARELTRESLAGVNTGRDIFLVEPDSNINGQFTFSDNLRGMIEKKAVLVLAASASTGQTLDPGTRVRGILWRASCRLCRAVFQYHRAARQAGRQLIHRVGFPRLSDLRPRKKLSRLRGRPAARCHRHPAGISQPVRGSPVRGNIQPGLGPRGGAKPGCNGLCARSDGAVTCPAGRSPASIRRDR